MTRTAIYDTKENTLTEQPEVEKPKYTLGHWAVGTALYDFYEMKWREYNAHVAACRTIPCSPECRGVFENGKVYGEGKDYEVKMDCKYPVSCFVEETCNCVFTAFPFVPVKSEDDFVWTDELVQAYAESYRFSSSRIDIEQFKADKNLQQAYLKTKKPTQ